ncbi:MAG: restriction endonuclease subunit S [Bryobacterales bacterium]|nr:restriction endonuclease subunit S [Bryobacterales bacterium]
MTESASLGEVATVISGQSPPGESYNEVGAGLPFFQGKADFTDTHPIARKWCTAPKKIAESGDILMSVRAPVGPTNIARERCCIGRGIAAIRPDESVALRDFVHWVLRSLEPKLSTKGQGSTFAAIGKKDILSIRIPLPSTDEQRRIVGVLNRTERIERLRAQAAERFQEFMSALFIKMFGDHGARSKDWPIMAIEQLLASNRGSIRTGPFGSQLKHSEFTEQGVPVLGIDNVVTNQFLWAKPRHIPPEKYANFQRYCVFPGDVIVTIMGTTGRVCVAPDDLPVCMSTKHLCVLTLDRSLVEPLFVWGALLFDENVRAQTRVQGQGQIMEGWNLTIVKRLHLRIPPIDIQRSFARIVARTIALGEIVSSSSSAASALSASLMADLLGDTV